MVQFIREEAQIPVLEGYDVVIAGGGVAGISAALAARRSGCKVLLLEKSVFLGGLATLGFVAIYLPLCDGMGKKVSAGIAEELLLLSIKYGYHTLPSEWLDGKGKDGVSARYRTNYSVAEFILALDELMEDAGIDVLYDSVCCKLIMDGQICQAAVVENKSGRRAYSAKIFIDSTGDLELMARAGAPSTTGDNWLTYWAYSSDLKLMQEAADKKDVYAALKLHTLGARWNGENHPAGAPLYEGLEAEEITKFILDGRRLLREDMRDSAGRDRTVVALPGMPQFRFGRTLNGYYTITEDDLLKRFDDSIGCVADFTQKGRVYEIPYRSLITPAMRNVMTAGRSMSASGDAWVMAKVIPGCSVTGQAAGLAAAQAIRKQCALSEVDVPELQNDLINADAILHYR